MKSGASVFLQWQRRYNYAFFRKVKQFYKYKTWREDDR